MNILSRLHWRVVKAILFAALICGVLASCASPVAVVTGNQSCIPASDLPPSLHMKKVPEVATGATALYGLLLDERASHRGDQEKYNSLYQACVK